MLAMRAAAMNGLHVQTLLSELHDQRHLVLHTDSSAALQTIDVGHTRHINIAHVWLQEAVKEKRLAISKIPGSTTPADVHTKAMAPAQL